MRFFAHDPAALRRKGRLLTAAGLIFCGALLVGALFDGGWANLMFILLAGVAGLGVALFGWSALHEAKALERERRILGDRRPDLSVPGVEPRPRRPEVEPALDVLPPFPTRRMICVTVMFAGLIAPALLGSLKLAVFGGPGAFAGLLLIGLSSWMCFNVVSLWKGRLWAWTAGVILFTFGTVIGATITGGALLAGSLQALAWGAGILSYFGCGLGVLCSLKGNWFRHLEWKPARDPLSSVDKKAVAKALRKVIKGS